VVTKAFTIYIFLRIKPLFGYEEIKKSVKYSTITDIHLTFIASYKLKYFVGIFGGWGQRECKYEVGIDGLFCYIL
jgi:hypothetical protein